MRSVGQDEMTGGPLGNIDGAVGSDGGFRSDAHARKRDMRLAASGNEEAGAHGVRVSAHDGVHALVLFVGEGLVVRLQGEVLVGVHR